MAHLGSSTLASHSDSLIAQREPIYVGGCPVPAPLEKDSARGGVGKGRGCSEEGSSQTITSRQSGARLGEHGHGAERHREDKASPRTSQNSPSETVWKFLSTS